MMKELFFDSACGVQIAALAEDGKLIELNMEDENSKNIVGSIYKGRVKNVVEGMNAAFIDCGLERNCYLAMNETFVDTSKYDSKSISPTKKVEVKEGEEVLVQVLKAPRGNKGAKVTTRLSFVGKNLIFMPKTDFLGISRKITEKELRETLLFTADQLRNRGDGLIVRTVSPYATSKRLKEEFSYLKNLYSFVKTASIQAKVGDVLYKDYELPLRVLRDSFNEDISHIWVGNEGLYRRIDELMHMRVDFTEKKLEKYEGNRDMLTEFGLSRQIQGLADTRVDLSSGAYLVIDRTEAMTVVDVNTGKFTGDLNLEDTVYATNIAAAREIARQMRLRDIGGIVVVDFIDMIEMKHRECITEELRQCLSHDRAKCTVLLMSDFCLTQFTRKRLSNGIADRILRPCPHCKHGGYILSNDFNILCLRSKILDCYAQGNKIAVIEMNAEIARKIQEKIEYQKNLLGKWENNKLYLLPKEAYLEEEYIIKGYKEKTPTLPVDAICIQ